MGWVLVLVCRIVCVVVLGLLSSHGLVVQEQQLSRDFYTDSCPNVERIVRNVVAQKLKENPTSAPGALRLFFHDCFVEVGGPSWEVLKGRRDGLISKASRVAGNLPTVNMTVDQLILLFHSKGLSPADMVTLSGGHTIGFAHCNEFMYRIYNYNKTYQVDPTMNPSYASTLRSACPREGLDPDVVAVNDVSTPTAFDNAYYQNVKRGFALLATDQILYGDPRTSAYVNLFATSQDKFFNFFGLSMIRLGNAGVKTGNQGEIRRDCGVFNN
ncbi:peroxidase 51 isoform X4 [Cryptomeria japonica]|uniref:peroxidase 51 isoform X4 n=1 Tax=Cryptomeria japonica TaxID=3369 RepID=UPI0027DA626C|nr:peroxidase 51 isoform X4 [Cryptomeria japonica]